MSELSIDYERRALSVPRRLMPSLLAVQTGSATRPDSANELKASGLLSSGRLDPLARTLLGTMTDPSLIVSLEITRASLLPRLVTLWQQGPIAVVGTTESRRFHIVQVDPALLPFHIAQALRIAPVAQPRYEGGFSIPPAVAAAFRVELDPQEVETRLIAAGVDRVWADRFLAAWILRRSLWSMEVVSLTNRVGQGTMSALDGGHAGYWTIKPQGTVQPLGIDSLLRRLAALLP
jgi:hypothetical protein